jgi:hypothetical protein
MLGSVKSRDYSFLRRGISLKENRRQKSKIQGYYNNNKKIVKVAEAQETTKSLTSKVSKSVQILLPVNTKT